VERRHPLRLPENATEPFTRFRADREHLRLAYRRLVAAATGDHSPPAT
jgi:hypothetical protein